MPDNEEAKTGLAMVQRAGEKIQSYSNTVVKMSGNTIIVAPKQYEKQAEGLKEQLDSLKTSK